MSAAAGESNPRYWKDIFNIIDICIFTFLMIYFYLLHNRPAKSPLESDLEKILGAILLILVYYRGFTHLRIISHFRILVGMINTITIKLWVFLSVLGYFFVCSSLLMVKLHPLRDGGHSFAEMYAYGLFGGIELDSFLESEYFFIPIIFGTLFISIVLLNILIAYLSNLFSSLEIKQHNIEMRQKAAMILEWEVIGYLFCYCRRSAPISKVFYDDRHRNFYQNRAQRVGEEHAPQKAVRGRQGCWGSDANPDKASTRNQLFIIKRKNLANQLEVGKSEEPDVLGVLSKFKELIEARVISADLSNL